MLTITLLLSINQKVKDGGLRVVIKKQPEYVMIDLYDQLAKKIVFS